MLEQIPPIQQVKVQTDYLPKLNFIAKAKDATASIEQIQDILDIQMHNVKKLGFITKEAQAFRDLQDQDYSKQVIYTIDAELKKRSIQAMNKSFFVEVCRYSYDDNEQVSSV